MESLICICLSIIRERQENAIETRSVTQGDLTEVGRSKRAKKSLM